MIPPRVYSAVIQTLQNLAETLTGSPQAGNLKMFFADEEGDPFAVELAGRVEGYVLSNDSDYVILNTDGYKGYIPMNEMVWTALSAEEVALDDPESDDGFQTVVNKARKKAIAAQKDVLGWGIIPPEDADDLRLSASVYSPAAVAVQLQIPASLLPLLGALVGNDFTGNKDPTTSNQTNLHWLFFERQLTLSQRITRVATTLRNILNAALIPNGKGKQKLQVNSVMELIERAVTTLMIRSPDTMASGERERVTERIVEATLQYAITRYDGNILGEEGLWESPSCPLHPED